MKNNLKILVIEYMDKNSLNKNLGLFDAGKYIIKNMSQ